MNNDSKVRSLAAMVTMTISNVSTDTLCMENDNNQDFLFETLHGFQVTVNLLLVDIVTMLIGILIITLNCILIHTLIQCYLQIDVTDIFIKSLAITDAFTGILILYNCLYNIINFQNRYECLFRFGLIQAMLLNSTGHISLLTINRYIKITRPLDYHNIFNKCQILILSGSVWCFSIIFGLLPLMGWSKEYTNSNNDKCQEVCRYFGIMTSEYIITYISLYWIPLGLMLIMYWRICQIARHHSREILAIERAFAGTGKDSRIFDKQSWKLTKTIFLVIGVYFICWLPAGILFIVQIAHGTDDFNNTELGNILTYTTGFGFLNSLLNPIIYATKIPCVKQRFRRVFCCMMGRPQSFNKNMFTIQDMNNVDSIQLSKFSSAHSSL